MAIFRLVAGAGGMITLTSIVTIVRPALLASRASAIEPLTRMYSA
jgi:hypothetical protein